MQAKRVQKSSQAGLIKNVQKQGKKRASPQLFSLSSLQSAAQNLVVVLKNLETSCIN